MNLRRKSEGFNNRLEERAFLGGAFDHVDFGPCPFSQGAGEDKSGKTAARSQVHPSFRFRREIEELKGVCDVARPDGWDGGSRNQVSRLLPLQQQFHEAIEPRQCFT